MTQTTIEFKNSVDIPEAHFYAFKACNNAVNWGYKQKFYRLKSELLKKHGFPADYDLQIIKKVCYTCNGKGVFKCEWKLPETCWSCLGDGIYQTKEVVLKRYLLNSCIFHEPIGELYNGKLKVFDGYEYDGYGYATFKYIDFTGTIVNKINGLIKHEPQELNPTWAFYYLLWNYNREQFLKCIGADVSAYKTRTQYKLKKLLERHTPLKAYADFLKVKKHELEPIDDLPF